MAVRATADHLSRAGVDRETLETELCAGVGSVGWRTPEDRLYSRHKLARAKRLDDVVIRTELEADHTVRLLPSSRQHDYRHPAVLPYLSAHLEPVHRWQHQVEHHQVRSPLPCQVQCGNPVRGQAHLVAFQAEVTLHHLGHHRFVVDYQNSSRHRTLSPGPPPLIISGCRPEPHFRCRTTGRPPRLVGAAGPLRPRWARRDFQAVARMRLGLYLTVPDRRVV